MSEPKTGLHHQLSLLGTHIYTIATDMQQDPNDGSPRPTRFTLSLGPRPTHFTPSLGGDKTVVRVFVEIRPCQGPHSSWARVTDEDAKAPKLTAATEAPQMIVADVWDRVCIYDDNDNNLYSGNRVGACSFFAEYCAQALLANLPNK